MPRKEYLDKKRKNEDQKAASKNMKLTAFGITTSKVVIHPQLHDPVDLSLASYINQTNESSSSHDPDPLNPISDSNIIKTNETLSIQEDITQHEYHGQIHSSSTLDTSQSTEPSRSQEDTIQHEVQTFHYDRKCSMYKGYSLEIFKIQ